jgi:hypothetical protein
VRLARGLPARRSGTAANGVQDGGGDERWTMADVDDQMGGNGSATGEVPGSAGKHPAGGDAGPGDGDQVGERQAEANREDDPPA